MRGCQFQPGPFRNDSVCLVNRIFERAKHQSERRPELVADIAEECRLRSIEFGERFEVQPLLFVCPGVGELRRNLSNKEAEKTAIAVIEWSMRIETRHND